MGMFDQAKDLYSLQKKAKAIKKKLKNLHIEAEANGIVVIINAEQEVISVNIPTELMGPENKESLQASLKEAFNKAIKKAQEVAAEEMRELMGGMGMNLPGMGGDLPAA
jgi:DNA-binding YbaB/EbfC family protein